MLDVASTYFSFVPLLRKAFLGFCRYRIISYVLELCLQFGIFTYFKYCFIDLVLKHIDILTCQTLVDPKMHMMKQCCDCINLSRLFLISCLPMDHAFLPSN